MKANGTDYEAQLETMAARARQWRAEHPELEARVQFNFPKTVCVIATISEAIKNKFVSCNEAGLELVKALHPWNVRTEPTVLMVRVVLEHEFV